MNKKNLITQFVVIVLMSILVCVPGYATEGDTSETQNASQECETIIQNKTIIDSAKDDKTVIQNSFALINTAPYNTISGTIETEQDSFTYPIEIDFSRTSQAAISLIETGDGYVVADIKDSDNNLLSKLGAGKASLDAMGNYNCIQWFLIDKPNPDINVYTYYVTVYCPTSNIGSANSYNINYGDSSCLEEMTSGKQNMVTLHYYRNKDENNVIYKNSYYSNRTPSAGVEHWYKFRHQFNNTVITVGMPRTNYTPIRFKIVDPDTDRVVYDSNSDSEAHRTEWITIAYNSVEKMKFDNSKLVAGREYNLVIYSPSGSMDPMSESYNLFVGQGDLMTGSVTVFAKNSATGTYNNYSMPVNITPANIPKNTAYVTAVSLKSATSGIRMSDIDPFEVRISTDGSWRRNTKFNYKINIPFNYGQTGNKLLASVWQIRFKSSSTSKTVTFIPGLYFNYEYEIGD